MKNFSLMIAGHAVVTLVGDDADHRRPRPRGRAAETNAAADDGRRVGPIGARHRFVDDGHRHAGHGVRRGEPAPAHEARPHRLERAVRHDLQVALGLTSRRFLEPLDVDEVVANRGRQRQGADDARGVNARQRVHPLAAARRRS